MKRVPLLLVLLAFAPPLFAQDKAEAPREFGFNFGYSYSSKAQITSVEISYQREFPNAKPAPFDETVTGKGGSITRETLSFLNPAGEVLGTLESAFDAQGHLQSQTLSEKGHPARALNWFKSATQSPELSVAGSILKADYTLKNGRPGSRKLKLQLPSGPRELLSSYDNSGRRLKDTTSGSSGPTIISFSYDASGLSHINAAANSRDKAKEISLMRAANGSVAQLVMKEEGVLVSRSFPRLDAKGETLGLRMEAFEEGVLSTVINWDYAVKNLQQESYENGVLEARKTSTLDDKGGQTLRSLEEFDAGHLQKRTQYDEAGAVSSITTFGADGSVKDVQKLAGGAK